MVERNKKILSDKEKELVEVVQLAYQKLYLNDVTLSRAVVEGLMVKVMKNTIGDKSFEIWLNHTKANIGHQHRVNNKFQM